MTVDPAHSRFHAIRPDWLALHAEDALEPDLPIVDPHHHLWDMPGSRYLLDELVADLATGHTIVATGYVQAFAMYRADGPEPLRPVGETEFANGVAAMSASGGYGPSRAAETIVGFADLRLGHAVEDVLAAHLRAAPDRFRGIRHITTWDDDPVIHDRRRDATPGMLGDPGFRAGFARLARLGLSFDAWLYQDQIDELTSLARAAPDTAVVLDHLGGPLRIGRYHGRDEAAFAAWARSLRALASCPNVAVKLGGLGMRFSGFEFHARPAPPRSEELAAAWRPYVETAIEAFGPERCMFESNFPVDKSAAAYPVVWNAFKRLAAGASPAEKHALFSGTARRVYRMAA